MANVTPLATTVLEPYVSARQQFPEDKLSDNVYGVLEPYVSARQQFREDI